MSSQTVGMLAYFGKIVGAHIVAKVSHQLGLIRNGRFRERDHEHFSTRGMFEKIVKCGLKEEKNNLI